MVKNQVLNMQHFLLKKFAMFLKLNFLKKFLHGVIFFWS